MARELATNPYKYTDKIINAFKKVWVVSFNKIKKSIMKFDEIEDLKTASETIYDVFAEMDKIVKDNLLKIAKHELPNESEEWLEMWILGYLDEPSPITKYSYSKEVLRKRERLIESIVAAKTKQDREKEVETGKRYWSKMVDQYAIEITDEAIKERYKREKILKVRWVTVVDERRCSVCGALHNKIFTIEDVPDKQHWNCRCRIVPVYTED